MAEKRDVVIDAEFTVAERRLTVSWKAAVAYVVAIVWLMVAAYNVPELAAPIVMLAGLLYPAWRLLSLLKAPSLRPEEYDQLAQRLRANARPGRARR